MKKTALTLAGTSLLTKGLFAAPASPSILSIQLYSVRDDMAKDPSGVLKQLASMGYRYVEHANYVNRKFYGYSAAEFKIRHMMISNVKGSFSGITGTLIEDPSDFKTPVV